MLSATALMSASVASTYNTTGWLIVSAESGTLVLESVIAAAAGAAVSAVPAARSGC
jgi:hypothetical protein